MGTVFVLSAQLPEADPLLQVIEHGAGARYKLETVQTIDELESRLGEVRQAVVFFAQPVEQLALMVQKLRLKLPSVACVAVVEQANIANCPLFEVDCHFVQSPLDEFSVLSQLSAAMRQSELLSVFNDSTQLDEVTHLFNRRYFLQRLGEEVSLAKRHLTPLCCVIVHVNFLPVYVDSYGYDFVNQLLRFLAERVRDLSRHEDIIARLSDDEIAILLPRSTEKGAKIFTNRLILELNASTFKYGGYDEEISTCAGVAGYPLPDGSPADADTIVRYARHAVHHARCQEEEHVGVQLFSEIEPVL